MVVHGVLPLLLEVNTRRVNLNWPEPPQCTLDSVIRQRHFEPFDRDTDFDSHVLQSEDRLPVLCEAVRLWEKPKLLRNIDKCVHDVVCNKAHDLHERLREFWMADAERVFKVDACHHCGQKVGGWTDIPEFLLGRLRPVFRNQVGEVFGVFGHHGCAF